MPEIKPEAINAGIRGIKTFASLRSASLIGALYFALASDLVRSILFTSARSPSPAIRERMASTTLAALPGPTII